MSLQLRYTAFVKRTRGWEAESSVVNAFHHDGNIVQARCKTNLPVESPLPAIPFTIPEPWLTSRGFFLRQRQQGLFDHQAYVGVDFQSGHGPQREARACEKLPPGESPLQLLKGLRIE